MFGIFGSISEFECSLITERVRSGQAAARRRGVRFGRPKVALELPHLQELRAAGASYAKIAERTGISVGKVHAALRA